MAKVVERPINPGKGRWKEKTIFRNSKTGEFITIHTVSANSSTFASDLGKAFRSNVNAALKKKK